MEVEKPFNLYLWANFELFSAFSQNFGKDDVIGCYIDLDEGIISYSKNGVYFDMAFEIAKNLLGSAFYPAVVLKVSQSEKFEG